MAPRRLARVPHAAQWTLGLAGVAVYLAVGGVGVHRYLENFWLYRGFPPPRDPAYVHEAGTVQAFGVASPAVGRTQRVLVFLPPGYARALGRRYPVLYLLHGFPGRPQAFLQTVRVGVVEDSLLARRRMQPLILVMPHGSTGTFTDEEWANGIGRHAGWETFVARDLVRAVDARYRTIPSANGRGIAGLSAGGYGALNIAFHHPDEFHVVESWSGYERAIDRRSIFGHERRLLAYNSPALQLRFLAPQLRRRHTFIWLYSGRRDALLPQNVAFVHGLRRYRVAHRFFVTGGGHTWAAWRGNAEAALIVAARRLGDET